MRDLDELVYQILVWLVPRHEREVHKVSKVKELEQGDQLLTVLQEYGCTHIWRIRC